MIQKNSHTKKPCRLTGLFALMSGLRQGVGDGAERVADLGSQQAHYSNHDDGQGLVEYAIILALVAIVVIAVMRLLGPKIGNTFSTIASSLP